MKRFIEECQQEHENENIIFHDEDEEEEDCSEERLESSDTEEFSNEKIL